MFSKTAIVMVTLSAIGCENKLPEPYYPPLGSRVVATGDRLMEVKHAQLLPGFRFVSGQHEFIVCTEGSRVAYISCQSPGFQPMRGVKISETTFSELPSRIRSTLRLEEGYAWTAVLDDDWVAAWTTKPTDDSVVTWCFKRELQSTEARMPDLPDLGEM